MLRTFGQEKSNALPPRSPSFFLLFSEPDRSDGDGERGENVSEPKPRSALDKVLGRREDVPFSPHFFPLLYLPPPPYLHYSARSAPEDEDRVKNHARSHRCRMGTKITVLFPAPPSLFFFTRRHCAHCTRPGDTPRPPAGSGQPPLFSFFYAVQSIVSRRYDVQVGRVGKFACPPFPFSS